MKSEVSLTVRALSGHGEFSDAVGLQRMIWNFGELELLPVRMFVVASRIGGQTLGAFDDRRMVGFCLAIPGIKPDGRVYLHSHMLGVLAEFRDAGAGRMLKLEQRREALARGIELVEWTFDPFEVKNAYFNLDRLGAVVPQYVRNMYGTTTSPLHGGLPTDRCVAQWWIASERVKLALHGSSPAPAAVREAAVPKERSAASQDRLADQFQSALGEGLMATGFDRERSSYQFGLWDSK
jgi:predicted GNAT superfamily acetyltransferase